ncbi:peroxide stress protein YaaA [Salipiger sp. 1_MG-2023]|uniref:peroxide stress protein YaaA n=1 Tax=Salipiger sp. 1_MG-2023 TaxID=3062665 RepID=UPI0026E3D043|nr:peroxide stress protein YaaA [Salipiger sp. 1_MG-2023]MDO6584110.1 peroxide stress protein YaaA [Salipiger sp. 1_MG-2023]
MLVVVSPAKKLDWSERNETMTEPRFADEAARLAAIARKLTQAELKTLMHLSDDLAKLNHERFRDFSATPSAEVLRPAVLGFAGDTYQGLEASSLDADEMAFAQGHLRILSGLYGVLRPLDGLQQYRLEMGSRLKTPRGKNLYDWWGDRIAKALQDDAKAVNAQVLVNCASQEYFGAVDTQALGLRVITPQFMEDKGGEPKIVSFYAKRARGAMARYIVQRRLTDPDSLTAFDSGGYAWSASLSEPDKPVFIRAA